MKFSHRFQRNSASAFHMIDTAPACFFCRIKAQVLYILDTAQVKGDAESAVALVDFLAKNLLFMEPLPCIVIKLACHHSFLPKVLVNIF